MELHERICDPFARVPSAVLVRVFDVAICFVKIKLVGNSFVASDALLVKLTPRLFQSMAEVG